MSKTGNIITDFERELGLPDNWTFKLQKEDDWSCIVKVHALLEGATTHALEIALDKPELANFLERLSLDGRAGKLVLAESMQLLHPEEIRFVKAVSKIRNACIHNIRNVSFDFDRLSKDQKNVLAEVVARILTVDKAETALGGSVKVWVLMAAITVIARLYQKKTLAQTMANANRRILEEHSGPRFTVDDIADWDAMPGDIDDWGKR